MGTRLHKRLGYGYANPQGSSDADAVINLVNPKSFLLNEDRLPFESMQEAWEDYVVFADAWSKERKDRSILLDPWFLRDRIKNAQRVPFVQEVVHRAYKEYATNDVIMVTPVGLLDTWSRFDNIIDYVEEQNIGRKTDLVDEVHTFQNGIYPFQASYLRTDTMETLSNDIMFWIRACNNDERPDSLSDLNDMAQLGGFDSHEHALGLVIPKPPADAVVMALWGKLFLHEEDAYKMRPVYYKYWS